MEAFLIVLNIGLVGALGLLYYIVFNHLRNHRIANEWRKLYEAEQERQRHDERMRLWNRLDKLENTTPKGNVEVR